ncbi:MAG: putative secondary metabolism biosynthetic enzyme [Trichoglossum hirsutum]|nr:MAG: putative secondary metabolism biosynthetic enzyme [Trichoglossum hirsutum]
MSPRPTWFLLSRPTPYVIHVEINRPSRLNAVFEPMWIELRDIFNNLSQDPSVRAVILSDAGDKAFTTGLDVQDCISAVERCEKPVICAMHRHSLGLAIDLSSCADIRICIRTTRFAAQEVDIGIAADHSTLSRLPKVVGSATWVKDICLSARIFDAAEAQRVGFVSAVLETKEAAIAEAVVVAASLPLRRDFRVAGSSGEPCHYP